VYEVDPAVFKSIQSTETSQGVIALVRPQQYNLPDIISSSNPLIVVLARLQDPGNVGTILRVAESFGAAGCIASTETASVLNSKAVRASAGSVFRMPHVWNVDLKQTILTLKTSKIHVVGMSPSAVDTIDWWDWRKPAAILVGNEGNGLSDEEVRMCDVAPHSTPRHRGVPQLGDRRVCDFVRSLQAKDRTMSGSLFEDAKVRLPATDAPLADRMRPKPSTGLRAGSPARSGKPYALQLSGTRSPR
jgi:tRNA(Leu) C34 or U34 (ribose-2'-O)-methylase TrmL